MQQLQKNIGTAWCLGIMQEWDADKPGAAHPMASNLCLDLPDPLSHMPQVPLNVTLRHEIASGYVVYEYFTQPIDGAMTTSSRSPAGRQAVAASNAWSSTLLTLWGCSQSLQYMCWQA